MAKVRGVNGESESSDQKPVRSLRERRLASSDEARPTAFQRVVRWLRPKDERAPVHPRRISPGRKVLLYRDKTVVQEIYNRVIALTMRDESVLAKLKRVIVGQPLLSGGFTFDGLAGVDEFVLKPSAKWTLGAEVGADIELKWDLSGDKSTDNAILMLISVMPVRGLSEVVRQIKAQRSDTPVEDLVYPGMPIFLRGTVRRKDDLPPGEIRLRDERRSAQVVLIQEHNLDQAVRFLKGRPLYVLGIIQSIEKTLTIKAGAVLLGQMCEEGPA